MVGQLLGDHVDPDAVAVIAREVLEHVLDYPSEVATAIAPFAERFGLARADGHALLTELLRRSGAPNIEEFLAEPRP